MQTPPKERELEYWTINFDGSLQLKGTGAGILITPPKGESFKYVLQMHFPASNNAAEYEALLHLLRIAMPLGIRRLKVLRDSLSIRPTKSGHFWMTKCYYMARSFAS
jgi:ribonuclease HI